MRNDEINEKIRELFSQYLMYNRGLLGLSQAELARRIDVSHTAVMLWERKRRLPNLSSAIRLAEIFGNESFQSFIHEILESLDENEEVYDEI